MAFILPPLCFLYYYPYVKGGGGGGGDGKSVSHAEEGVQKVLG